MLQGKSGTEQSLSTFYTVVSLVPPSERVFAPAHDLDD
jgi:hypothetical protein